MLGVRTGSGLGTAHLTAIHKIKNRKQILLATPETLSRRQAFTVIAWPEQQPLTVWGFFLITILFSRVTKGISRVKGVLRSVLFRRGAAFAKVLVRYESVSVLK